jgi:hypothetical protein
MAFCLMIAGITMSQRDWDQSANRSTTDTRCLPGTKKRTHREAMCARRGTRSLLRGIS